MFPLTRVPFWVPILDPQPYIRAKLALGANTPDPRAIGFLEYPSDPARLPISCKSGAGSRGPCTSAAP